MNSFFCTRFFVKKFKYCYKKFVKKNVLLFFSALNINTNKTSLVIKMSFNWICEPIRILTEEEPEILQKIEKKITKYENCFLHPQIAYHQNKQIYVRTFLYDIFVKDDADMEKNCYIFVQCGKKKCVNPNHLVKTRPNIALRLNVIGWDHFDKPDKEIIRLFELQTLLKRGKQEDNGCLLWTRFTTTNMVLVVVNLFIVRGGNWKIHILL